MKTVRGDVVRAVNHAFGNEVSVVVSKDGYINKVFTMSADECMELGRELIAAAEKAAAKGKQS